MSHEQANLPFRAVKYLLYYGHNVYHCKDGGMSRKITEAAVYESNASAMLEVKRLRQANPSAPLPKLRKIT